MKTALIRTAVASLLVIAAGCNSWKSLWPWGGRDTAASGPVVVAATRPSPLETELRGIVTYLASGSLEGRGIHTPGIDAASEYLRNKFVAAGLQKVPGQQGYYQEFEHTTVAGISPGTALVAGGQTYELTKDYTVLSSSAEGEFSGPVVFAGYGISSGSQKYDDFAGIDVKGKVVLVFRFEPHDEKGNSRFDKDGWSTAAHLRSKFRACAAQGAAAVLLVNPPHHHAGDALLPFARSFQEAPSSIPVLQVTQGVANALLKRGGAPDLATLQDRIDHAGAPASLALKDVAVSGNVALRRNTRTLRNVLALLPGQGPLALEYVVVGAHYDHLGYGGPGSLSPGNKVIHYGADDNASGTAALVALAAQMAKSPPPDRSIVFVAFTAEESGLIGSQQFVQHPPVPLDRVAAMLNMDMVGRVRDEMLFVGGGGTAAPFERFLKEADEASPLAFKDFGKGGLAPSDHMSFAVKKIPVLFLFSGMHRDYHRPTDTADKINYAGLAGVVRVAHDLVDDLAQMPRAEYVVANDAKNAHGAGTGLGTGSRVSLGVIPDYGTDISKGGVRITGASPGSPAEKAGLKEGDVIVGFNSKPITNLYDLTDVLAGAKAGQKVSLKVLRGGAEITLEATLVERQG